MRYKVTIEWEFGGMTTFCNTFEEGVEEIKDCPTANRVEIEWVDE